MCGGNTQKSAIMKQDDVIRITRSLGICELTSKPKQSIHYSLTIHEMLDLFNLVQSEEREACAFLCDELWRKGGWDHNAGFAADCIRAKGKHK